ncbi:MAG: hypothetical protein ACYTA3_00415, partial [Planctomycetota bacterium]
MPPEHFTLSPESCTAAPLRASFWALQVGTALAAGSSGAGRTEENMMETESYSIDRRVTGIRFLLTLLFFLIAEVLQTVLALIILFELLYTLVTEAP